MNITTINRIILLVSLLFLSTLGNAQTPTATADTINRVDAASLKQGYWVTNDKFTKRTLEEGRYIDNKKTGIWNIYFPTGKLQCSINYILGKPNGAAKLYHENGNLAEVGTWVNDKWVGEYKLYYPSGTMAYSWNFDETGKRTGVQKYFYENGKPMYEGEWKQGKNSSNLTIFDDKGAKIGERVYNDSKFSETLMINNSPTDTLLAPAKEYRDFNLTGNSTIVNFNGKVDKSGYFMKGKLMNGTSFEYDAKNNLVRKIIYRDGEIFKTVEIGKN